MVVREDEVYVSCFARSAPRPLFLENETLVAVGAAMPLLALLLALYARRRGVGTG